MLFDVGNDGLINTSVREVCEFLRRSGDAYSGSASLPLEKMKRGAAFHRQFQRQQEALFDSYCPEYRLGIEAVLSEPFVLNLTGIADGIADSEDIPIIDEIKTTSKKVSELDFGSIPQYDLQLYLYAYMYMREECIERVRLRLIYHNCDGDETGILERDMTYTEAEEIFTETVNELLLWIRFAYEHRKKRNETVSSLVFPFGSYRKGQRELCAAVYRSIRDSENLFAEAPTGIGKTVSALFPAYKALGEDRGDKLFYLTAKAVQRGLAKGAVERMRECGLHTRIAVLTAKSKSCLSDGNCMPTKCKYSNGCFDRMNEALWACITSEYIITPEVVADYAERYTVCPHELMLDVTYFCDCVIGDYNHLYDPQAALQRYFSVGGDYIALVDEAHNLPDRARDMYTARLSTDSLKKAHKALKEAPRWVRKHFSALSKELKALSSGIPDGEDRLILGVGDGDIFEEKLSCLCESYKTFLGKDEYQKEKDATLEVFFDCSFLLTIAHLAREHSSCYRVYLEAFGRDTVITYACTNPAPLIGAISGSIRSSVFFSATLNPFDYYTELLAMSGSDKYIRLPSPFPSENRLIAIYGGFSTRLRDREGSYGRAAEIIRAAVSERKGNYLAFFPSFKYLSEVLYEFSKNYPDIETAVQESVMDDTARAEFLASFEDFGERTLVGFAVCGGLFSEGIDLTGDRLSGVIIFGTGMPSICFERDLIRSSFETPDAPRRGFSYAYTYPGLGRVFQAAGRVIRTESDKGFIVLCDDRYKTSEYSSHFPPDWNNNLRKVGGIESLSRVIREFWEKG